MPRVLLSINQAYAFGIKVDFVVVANRQMREQGIAIVFQPSFHLGFCNISDYPIGD